MDKTVEVSQAARDAAADAWTDGGTVRRLRVRDGNMDSAPLVQAFARFEAALQPTTRATQPEAALREALEGEAQVYFPPELDKELARIEWPRSRSLLHEAALFCGRVQVLNGDARLTAQAVDLGDRLRAALKDHRHG